MVAILEINGSNRLAKALECRMTSALLFFIIIIVLLIINLFVHIDILWWLNIIGLSLNFLAALIIGEGTIIKSFSRSINGDDKQTFYQNNIFLKIGTNLLLVGFSLQLISLIIPASFLDEDVWGEKVIFIMNRYFNF